MSTATFDITPDWVFPEEYNYRGISTRFEDGYIQTRPAWRTPRRRWTLNWRNAPATTAEQVKAFVRDMNGAGESFYYTVTASKLPRPYLGPTCSHTSGGSLPQRTRYAKYSWATTGMATTVSVNSTSRTVLANYLLTVTVPEFPAGVTFANVYVSADDSTFNLQADTITTSGGMWTEPETGYDAGGAEPPTSNTFEEQALVYCVEDSLETAKRFADYYDIRCVFEEA